MERQTIVEKPPWWKPRTGRGLMVIELCLIVLCAALTISMMVIVAKSGSSDASDSDTEAEMLPSKPEAFVLKYFWRNFYKKMDTLRTTPKAPLDAHGPLTKQTEKPVTKRTETTTPKQDTVTKGSTWPVGIGPVTKRTKTAEPKHDAATTAATRPHAVRPGSKRNESIEIKQDEAITDATQPRADGPVSKRTQTATSKQDVETTPATRPHAVGPVTKRTERRNPQQYEATTDATRPHTVGSESKQTGSIKFQQDEAIAGATRPRAVGPVTKRTERKNAQPCAATTDATRPHTVGPGSKRTGSIKTQQDVATTDATRLHVVGPESKKTGSIKSQQDGAIADATRPRTDVPATERTETAPPKQDAVSTGAALPDKIATTPKPINTTQFCETDTCGNLATKILEYMDHDADPCEDFYQYACGGFLNSAVIPNDDEGISTFTLAEGNLQLQLSEIIQSIEGPDEPKSFKVAATLYESCMNTHLIEEKGIKPLVSILEDLRGGLSNDSLANYWQFLIARLENVGFFGNYLIKSKVDVDVENNTTPVIYLDQPDLGLSRAFLVDNHPEIRDYYRQYMTRVAKILNPNDHDIESQFEAVMLFERQLADISSPEETRMDERRYYRTTMAKLTEKYPGLSYLKNRYEALLPLALDFSQDKLVILKADNYFEQLGRLISNKDDMLTNYILWRAVMDYTMYTNGEIRRERWSFNRQLTGVSGEQPRWKECLDVVSNAFPLSVTAMYAKRYFPDDTRNGLERVLEDYTKAIAETLKQGPAEINSNMMEIARKKQATARLMYPTEKDKVTVENLYAQLALSKDNYFGNILNLTKLVREYEYSESRKLTLESDWVFPRKRILTQARYSKSKNSVDVPTGILQSPFFSNDRPSYLNDGALGFLISRQFAHAFGNSGRHYDQKGSIIKAINRTIDQEYRKISNCLIAKYRNYSSPNVNLTVNAVTMQNENFADIAGLKIAYSVYENRIAKNGDEPKLPHVDENPKQLFWISAAQTLCSKYKPQAEAFKIKTEAYFPDRFRVLGAMSNMPEFSNDFSCPVGSKMNPEEKCPLW